MQDLDSSDPAGDANFEILQLYAVRTCVIMLLYRRRWRDLPETDNTCRKRNSNKKKHEKRSNRNQAGGHLSDDNCASSLSIGHSSRPLALSPQLGQRINGLTLSFIGKDVQYMILVCSRRDNFQIPAKGFGGFGIFTLNLVMQAIWKMRVTQSMDQLQLTANQLGG